MKKAIVAFAVVFNFIQSTHAQGAKDSISEKYLMSLQSDLASVKEFSNNFRENSQPYCPGFSGSDRASCLSAYLLGNKPKSSTEAMIMLNIVAETYASQKKSDQSPNFAKLALAENILLVFESLDLSQFRLAKMPTVTEVDKKELAALKVDDEKHIKTILNKTVGGITKKLREVEKSKELKSQAKQSEKLNELKSRYQALKSKQWKYAS